VLFKSFHIALETATKLQTEESDILIRPDLCPFNTFDISKAENIIEIGYMEAKRMLGENKIVG
jgi:NTE family protein